MPPIIVKTLKAVLEIGYYPLLCQLAIRKYAREEPSVSNVTEAFEFACRFKAGLHIRGLFLNFAPLQNRSEILSLLQILQAQKPKYLCEIGTASGGTLYLFSKVASQDARLVSVDLPGGAFGAGYQKSKMQFLKKFASDKQEILLVRDDSHSERARLKLENLLNGKKLDFLLIDGDHSYNGVKADFMTYRSLVSKGGLIAFHDIVPGDPRFVGGVPAFWAEIKVDFKHAEFVDSWNQGGAGIGVLWND